MRPLGRSIRIETLTNQELIADKCYVAESFFERVRGLIGTKSLEVGEGMWFGECNNIHMWFMSIPIDVLFVRPYETTPESVPGKNYYTILSVRPKIRPWRLFPVHGLGATDTVELPAGTAERCQLKAGDTLVCTS